MRDNIRGRHTSPGIYHRERFKSSRYVKQGFTSSSSLPNANKPSKLDKPQLVIKEEIKEHDYSKDYFTMESLEDGNTIYFKGKQSPFHGEYFFLKLSASTDDGSTWRECQASSGVGGTVATLNKGEKVLIKANNAGYGRGNVTSNYFNASKKFVIYGNILSLCREDFIDFDVSTSFLDTYTFFGLFSGCTTLVSAENLVLHAPVWFYHYAYMFDACTNLEIPPKELPKKEKEDGQGLYQSCVGMFSRCTSLKSSPRLMLTKLGEKTFKTMFARCTSLEKVTCLATDIRSDSTTSWLSGVAPNGVFVKAASMNGWGRGDSGIPIGWTIENE